jgi:hypothetical protein
MQGPPITGAIPVARDARVLAGATRTSPVETGMSTARLLGSRNTPTNVVDDIVGLSVAVIIIA